MKPPIIPATALVLLSLINFTAIMAGNFWVENLIFLLVFVVAVFLVFPKHKNFGKYFYFFIGLTCLSYLVRFLPGDWMGNVIALLFLSMANVALILESKKFIVPKKASNLMGLYFVLVLGVNFSLLAVHVFELREFIANEFVFWVYGFYYFNLFALAVTSFLYYLNSYSRKAVYFISLVLGIIFADVLRDMSFFYFQDPSVQVAESIIRVGCAVFAVLFFVTKEKQLRLANLI